MKIFINEKSLHFQYNTIHDFADGVIEMSNLFQYLQSLNLEKEVHFSNSFHTTLVLEDVVFQSALKALSPDINRMFVENWSRLNPKSWERERIHNAPDTYDFMNEPFCNTTVGEAAEHQIRNQNFNGFLLNFIQSRFESPSQQIIKNVENEIRVFCKDSLDSIYNWLIERRLVVPSREYLSESKYPPRDEQTILNNRDLFSPTKFRNHGRRIYTHIETSQKWVIDNLHYGQKAHIEVFDQNDYYLGESPISVIQIDSSKAGTKYLD